MFLSLTSHRLKTCGFYAPFYKIKAICNKVMRRFIADERSETSRLLEIIIEECDTVDEAVLATYLVNDAFEKMQSMTKSFERITRGKDE